MKKLSLLLLFAVMLALGVGIGYAAEKISIRKGIEIMPPRGEITAPANYVCWQTVYDPKRKILRQQIFPVNGADQSAITQEMKDSLMTIRPAVTVAEDWQSFGFTCRPAGWKGFVDYGQTVAAASVAPARAATVVPLPKIAAPPAADPSLKAELDALKAKLAAAETAEAKRLADAQAEAARKARKAAEAAKRAEADKKTAACIEGLKKLGYEGGVEGIKKFQSKYALTQDGVAGSATCAQMRAVLAACTDCKDEPAAAPAAK